MSTVISAIEPSDAVTSKVYVAPLPEKLLTAPPDTLRSPTTKSVTDSLNVTVY